MVEQDPISRLDDMLRAVDEWSPEADRMITEQFSDYCNQGAAKIGFLRIGMVMAECSKLSGLPIVEVGSGRGVMAHIAEFYGAKEVICFDPNPFSCVRGDEILFHPTNTHTLEESSPELIARLQGCVLVIIWPLFERDNVLNPYDYEAVKLLNPHFIVTVIDKNELSGSTKFKNFVSDSDSENMSQDEIRLAGDYSGAFAIEKRSFYGYGIETIAQTTWLQVLVINKFRYKVQYRKLQLFGKDLFKKEKEYGVYNPIYNEQMQFY